MLSQRRRAFFGNIFGLFANANNFIHIISYRPLAVALAVALSVLAATLVGSLGNCFFDQCVASLVVAFNLLRVFCFVFSAEQTSLRQAQLVRHLLLIFR